tara:strand:- start:1955 stop:3187 length:1233 start_codon:yes stop_codon:yes gene_type:complete
MNKNLTMAGLGFTSGLPYMLIFSTLSIWLRDVGIDLTIIGFFAWISLTYSLKFLWSPLVDRYSVPIFQYFGSRKSWIILMQILIFIFLICLSRADPTRDISYLATFAILIALAGSFQDIAIDAFRIELANIEEQGNLAAYYQFGYRAAILTATSFALIYAENYSWSSAYFLMAVLMLLGLIALLITPERANHEKKELSFFENFSEPIKDFVKRFNLFAASILLLIIATYRLTDIVMGPMANPFYIDMGFSLTEIGSVVKIVALVASIIGLFLGGILIKNFGLYKSLLFGAFAVMISNVFFSIVAISEPNLNLLSIIVFTDSFSAGVVGTVNIAFLTSLVSKKFTATQYALLTSFMMLPGKIFSGFSGVLADYFQSITNLEVGWMIFFIFTSILAIPAIILVSLNKNLIQR